MSADHELSNVVALCAASHAGWSLYRSLDDVWVHAVDQINCSRTSMASNMWWLCMVVVWDESRPESEVCGDGIHPRANEAVKLYLVLLRSRSGLSIVHVQIPQFDGLVFLSHRERLWFPSAHLNTTCLFVFCSGSHRLPRPVLTCSIDQPSSFPDRTRGLEHHRIAAAIQPWQHARGSSGASPVDAAATSRVSWPQRPAAASPRPQLVLPRPAAHQRCHQLVAWDRGPFPALQRVVPRS